MGSDRVQVDGKSSSTLTPGFKRSGSSFLEQRYQEQVEAETTSPTEEKQLSSSEQPNPTPPPLDPPPFGHSFGQVSVRPIQAKLTIGQPGDKYEQEADRVAEQVMRMSEPMSGRRINPTPIAPAYIQPLCSECEQKLQRQEEEEEDEDEETIQSKAANSNTPRVTPAVENHPNASRGSGQPLPESTRAFIEPRFGHDFSRVRVHTDTHATSAAQSLNAQAFTHGDDIYFGSGYYQPHTRAGQHLLAHEITHVVQQTGGVQLKSPALSQSKTEAVKANARSTQDSLLLWRFVQTKLELNSTNSSLEEEQTPTIQRMCSQCAEEEKIQRQPTQANISNINKITPIPSGDDTIQALSLEDVGSALSSGAEWVGGQVSAGAEWVGEQGENLLEMGAEAFMEIIERISPGLAELIRNGPEGLLSEKIGAGIQAWLQDFLGDFDISSAVNNLQESLAGVFANIQGALAGDEASCAAFAEGINSLRNLATAFMENPAVQAIQEAFAKVGDFLQQVSNLVLAPVFDALMEIAGGIFDGVTELASTIWEWGGRVRDFLGRAWDWVLEQLGIGGDSEGGILEWLQEKASAVWSEIKETFAPVIEPITKVLQIMLAFSPAGPFLAVVTYGPQLIEAVEWLWNNKDNPDIVRAAHEQMGNTILPQLLSAAQGFSQTLQTTVNSFVEQVLQIGEGVLELLGAVTGVPLLSVAQNLVQTVSNGIQELVTWSQQTFQAAAEWVQNLFTKIQKTIEPYAEVLSSLALAIVNPGMIPVILAGWAWRLLPDCYKAPIINFLLDTVIAILEAAPSLPIFGLLWSIIKTGVIGFLQGVKNQDDQTKVAITNKLAKIISGASLDFIFGFVKGLLIGLWEGLTDPFKLIYMAIQGLGNLIVWLNGVADQALSPTPTETESSATADNRAVLGDRLPQMARELQPPVEEVTGGFMPAVEEFFSGGEGMSFEELIQKLGEAWDAVETAIRNAGNQLAEKVVGFLTQDSAEGSMGEAVGWLAGTIIFEVVLAILTAGTWTAASGAMKILKGFARILDWTGEVLGVAFKALAKVGGFIIDGLKGLRKLLSNAGGAARAVLDALGEIGEKLIRFADELLGRVGKGAAGEVVEETAEKAAKETAEVGAERASKEAVEELGERSSKEAAEAGSERGAKETADDALKAAELPAAIAQAAAMAESLEATGTPIPGIVAGLSVIKARYRWIKTFEVELKSGGIFKLFLKASKHYVTDIRARRRQYKKNAQNIDRGVDNTGHSYADHGAHTNPEQHRQRLLTGDTPGGYTRAVPNESSKFATHRAHVDAYNKAQMELGNKCYKKNGQLKKEVTVVFNMPGAGFSYTLDAVGNLNPPKKIDRVYAFFKLNSHGWYDLITMYPKS